MCYDSNARPPAPPGVGGTVHTDELILTAADGARFEAFLATPSHSTGIATLIYPDIRGLHFFYKELAVRFAEQGIASIAIDFFGRTAGVTARDDAFEFRPHVEKMTWDTFQADVDAGLARLRQLGAAAEKVYVVGFCMGGALSFMTGVRDIALAGLIGFYSGMTRDMGHGTLLDQAAKIKFPALGLFGGADAGIPAEKVEAFDRELDRAGVKHTIITYPGAPHSYFDRRATDYAEASADSWVQMLKFMGARS